MSNDYRKYTCPACNGKGCQLCQGKGTVMASKQEIDEVKALLRQLPPMPRKKPAPPIRQPQATTPTPTTKSKSPLALVLTIIVLSVLAIGALFSFIYFKSLKPFLFGLTVIAILAGSIGLWQSPLINAKEPQDFISGIAQKQKKMSDEADNQLPTAPAPFLN